MSRSAQIPTQSELLALRARQSVRVQNLEVEERAAIPISLPRLERLPDGTASCWVGYPAGGTDGLFVVWCSEP
jgi:hypothetical protein